jgi:microsomal dipeptidase-like Zn-dependent dipeptidase
MPVDTELLTIAMERLAASIKRNVSDEQMEHLADELALKLATCIEDFIEELGE